MPQLTHATTPIVRLTALARADNADTAIGPVYADTRLGFDDRAMDGWYTLPQARAYLVVSANTLRRLVKRGIIRSFSPKYTSHITLYSRDDCRKLLADSARDAGMFSGCANPALAQGKEAGQEAGQGSKRKKKSTPKST